MGGRLRPFRDDGQTTAEYVGLIVIVGIVLGAIAAGPLGGRLSELIQQAICQVSGEPCPAELADAGTPEYACEISGWEGRGGIDARVGFVDLGAGTSLRMSERSDGTFRVTTLDDGTVGASLKEEAGGVITFGDRTVGLESELGAGVALLGERSETRIFDDREAAQRYAVEQAVEEGVELLPPGAQALARLGMAGRDALTGGVDDGEEGPSTAQVSLEAKGKGSATLGPAGAVAERSAGAGARLTTLPGGGAQASVLVDTEKSGSAGVPILADFAKGTSGAVEMRLSWDRDGDLQDLTMIGEMASSGGVSKGVGAEDLDDVLRSVGTKAGVETGERTVVRADLDLTDPALQDSARRFFQAAPRVGQPVPDIARLASAGRQLRDPLYDAGTISTAVYRDEDFEAGIEGKLSHGLGGAGGLKMGASNWRLHDASYLNHQTGELAPWAECTG